jgi:hypothetical protein
VLQPHADGEAGFVKSSLSGSSGCVEVARSPDGVVVRDSKDRTMNLRFSINEWTAFVAGVKAGEFDIS